MRSTFCNFAGMKARWTLLIAGLLLLTACSRKERHTFTDELLLPMTPIKDQGKSQLCWAYAMLATIETEHLLRGDSVNLSAVYIGRMLREERGEMRDKNEERAMGQTLLNMIQKYGIVPYDVMPDNATDELPTPKWVFMLGARYTPWEFAHSVCAPDEYVGLTCFPDSPYNKKIVVPVPDNWEQNRLMNLPLDTLRKHIDNALQQRHPVCWESRGHAMCIVGMARDENRRPYYIMKNSWGPRGPHDGLVYMSFRKMWKDMIALYLTKEAFTCSVSK